MSISYIMSMAVLYVTYKHNWLVATKWKFRLNFGLVKYFTLHVFDCFVFLRKPATFRGFEN